MKQVNKLSSHEQTHGDVCKENTSTSGDVSLSEKVNAKLKRVVQHWQRKFLMQQLLLFIPVYLLLVCAIYWLIFALNIDGLLTPIDNSPTYLSIALCVTALCAFAGKMFFMVRSQAYKNITLTNLLFHLNRQYPELEESAQLLLSTTGELSPLEQLQREKVCCRVNKILLLQQQANYEALSPIFAQRRFITLVAISFSFLIVTAVLGQSTWLNFNNGLNEATSNQDNVIGNKAIAKASDIHIISKQVVIEPPAYSLVNNGKRVQPSDALHSDDLNIKALVGSKATWYFRLSNTKKDYYLNFSNGEQHKLVKALDGSFQLQLTLTSSMVYHLSIADNEQPLSADLTSVYSIKLIADEAPKVRFINPKITVTEFSKTAQPTLMAQVQISDDFAITEVKILASIAKGSGEGVKFRDQYFDFDRTEIIDGKAHYFKAWALFELGMEPGDELYFSVFAKDNRNPHPQTTRSGTKIIRWLEEGQLGINADGILIDFMPEYFKSQRQIIIETIELIEDKKELSQDKFNETSEILGVAQSTLKEKYGQYLGDEFEGQQSVGVTFDDDHSEHEHGATENNSVKSNGDKHHRPTIHVHDDHGGSNAVITAVEHGVEHNVESGHSHEETSHTTDDISGKMALIDRYGHNHEDSDIGVMGSQDPKALMKKSLENMWQAELHLMLSQPELALPFEQQALKLLKRAKKAERIYVKRLGFEPPPVTEKRRYQGEENDVLAGQVQRFTFEPAQLSNQTQRAFTSFLQTLNTYEQTNDKLAQLNKNLTNETLALVKTVKQGLAEKVASRPALVSALAIVERILLKQSLTLDNCADCLTKLAAKLTQLVPDATAVPIHQTLQVSDEEPLLQSYSDFLKDQM